MNKNKTKTNKVKVTTNLDNATPEQMEAFLEKLGKALWMLTESIVEREYGQK